jgi:hypothetical protein
MILLMLLIPFGSWVEGVDALRLGLLFFELICPIYQSSVTGVKKERVPCRYRPL